MKKLLLIIFIIPLFCFGQDTLSIEILEPENVFDYFLYSNDVVDSNFTGFDTIKSKYLNEEISIYLEFISGEKVSAIGYYDNGQKYREAKFKNGELHGMTTQWYKNGKICFQVDNYNGKQIGVFISWHDNGKLQMLDDYYNGRSYSWYKNGELENETIHLDSAKGSFIEYRYFDNGVLFTKGKFNEGRQLFSFYYRNSKPSQEGYIYNDLLNRIGKWQEWYDDGSLKREFFFNEKIPNRREGKWIWWNEKGKIIKQEKYLNGELIKKK